jgi:hypothetical protein
VELQYISTDEQIADILSKPLSRVKGQAWSVVECPPLLGGRCAVSSHAD